MLLIKLKGTTHAATWEQISTHISLSLQSLGGGVKRSKFNFLRKWSCCLLKLKGNEICISMQAPILSLHTPSTPGVGLKVKTFFSESCHFAYQINGNGAQSTVQAHIPSLHSPWVPGWGQKFKTFFF